MRIVCAYAALLVSLCACCHHPVSVEIAGEPRPAPVQQSFQGKAEQIVAEQKTVALSSSDIDILDELDAAFAEMPERQDIDYRKADPLERLNRFLYVLHRGVDLLFVRPIAMTYSKALPTPVRKGVSNFAQNLTAPVRFLCHILQGNIAEAGKTAGCFAVNSVLGVGGIFNVAKKLKAEETPTNFTATFKKWGMEPGPYIVIPGIGPATFRSALGFLCDSFLDPVFLFTLNKDLPYNDHHALMWCDTGVQLTGLIISRSKIDLIYEDIENNASNRYSKLRSLVLHQSSNQ